MSVSERLSILGHFPNVLQGFFAPELGELKVRLDTLSDGQKTILSDMREGFKAQNRE